MELTSIILYSILIFTITIVVITFTSFIIYKLKSNNNLFINKEVSEFIKPIEVNIIKKRKHLMDYYSNNPKSVFYKITLFFK